MATQTEHEQRLDAIIAAYHGAIENEGPQDRDDWLERYAEFASDLEDYFVNLDCFSALAKPFRANRLDKTTDEYRPTAGGDNIRDDHAIRPSVLHRKSYSPGDVFAGNFLVEAVHGGGMGIVYVAKDLKSHSRGVDLKVAIKTVAEFDVWRARRQFKGATTSPSDYENLLERFRREAEAWVRLGRHENIIYAAYLVDVGEKPHLVTEFADRGDLSEWIQNGQLDLPLAINFAIQFCQGMMFAAERAGMVHRDIKPANILISNDSFLKIADFGLAKAHWNEELRAQTNQPPGEDFMLSVYGAGTLPYMAREQISSLANADVRSDVFSFGATLYEMVTGQRLFPAKDLNSQLAQRSEPFKTPKESFRNVPDELWEIINRCVADEPSDRFQDFGELRRALWKVFASIPGRPPIPRDARRVSNVVNAVSATQMFIALRKYEEAIECANSVLQNEPQNADLLINKATALHKQGNLGESKRCLAHAIKIDNRNALALANYSLVALQDGDLKNAFAAATHAVALDESLCDAWLARARCYEEAGDLVTAESDFRKATERASHNWAAHYKHGTVLFDLHRPAEAAEALKKCLELNPDRADSWAKYGICLFQMGKGNDAQGAVDRAISIEPNRSDSWVARGIIQLEWENSPEAARASFEKALRIEPTNERARKLLEHIQCDSSAM